MELATETYRLTKSFPNREMYGLVSQMRRSSISIAANIAEGREHLTTREFLRFLAIANGSLCELRCYLDLGQRLGYATESEVEHAERLADRIARMLTPLRVALGRKLRLPSGAR